MDVAFNFLNSPCYLDFQLLVFVLEVNNFHLELGHFVPCFNLLVVELFDSY